MMMSGLVATLDLSCSHDMHLLAYINSQLIDVHCARLYHLAHCRLQHIAAYRASML